MATTEDERLANQQEIDRLLERDHLRRSEVADLRKQLTARDLTIARQQEMIEGARENLTEPSTVLDHKRR